MTPDPPMTPRSPLNPQSRRLARKACWSSLTASSVPTARSTLRNQCSQGLPGRPSEPVEQPHASRHHPAQRPPGRRSCSAASIGRRRRRGHSDGSRRIAIWRPERARGLWYGLESVDHGHLRLSLRKSHWNRSTVDESIPLATDATPEECRRQGPHQQLPPVGSVGQLDGKVQRRFRMLWRAIPLLLLATHPLDHRLACATNIQR